jgi:hypothetical protein
MKKTAKDVTGFIFLGRYRNMKIVFYEKGELSIIVGASKLKGELTIEQIKNESEKKAKELGELLGREIGFLIDMNGKLDAALKK